MHDHHAHRSQILHKLLRSPITEEMIDYVTWKAMAVIPCTLPSPPQDSSDFSLNDDFSYMQQFPAEDLPLTPPNAPNESEKMHTALPSAPPPLPGQVQVPPLREFIANLVQKSRLHTGTFLATLVYLERLRSKLYSVAKGMPCTCHRVFLSTLIVTAKYVNDTSPKNRNWARYSSVFSVAEVNLMEKQLLVLLDFHLSISMDELVKNIEFFLPDENPTPQLSKYRPSLAEYPDLSTCRIRRPVHRYSMPAYLESGNLARSYLVDTSEDYPHECASETVTPKLSDSSYSSDEYNEDSHHYSAPNSSLTDIVAPPPASYHPPRQRNVTRYDSTTLHFSSNNPYRAKHQLEHKQYEIENDPSSSLYGSNVMSAINGENSVRNSRPRR